jgi:hypothetical protein
MIRDALKIELGQRLLALSWGLGLKLFNLFAPLVVLVMDFSNVLVISSSYNIGFWY